MAKKTKQARTFPAEGRKKLWNESPEHLKEWRETLGITQPELAKEAHVSKALIALIEKNQRPLVEPSRSALWDAVGAILSRQILDPDSMSPALKFWATFFGPLETGQLMGLAKTPAERVRDYARQEIFNLQQNLMTEKADNERIWSTNKFLLDLFDAEGKRVDELDKAEQAQMEQIREEAKQRERVKKGR